MSIPSQEPGPHDTELNSYSVTDNLVIHGDPISSRETLEGGLPLSHPILRCPEDILRRIFEILEDMTRFKIRKQSRLLSSVCSQWRTIALDTPKLWSAIELYLEKPPEKQEFLRKHIIPRVKHFPAYVIVRSVDSGNMATLSASGLYEIPIIETLSLKLSTARDAALLLSTNFTPPARTVETLRIWTMPSHRQIRANMEDFDLFRFITYFPSLSSLWVKSVPNTIFTMTTRRFHLTYVRLCDVGRVDLVILLTALPQVESVSIEETKLVAESSQDVVSFPSVKELNLGMIEEHSWMTRILFPRLKALEYSITLDEVFLNFISQHRAITRLECVVRGDTILELANVAPQLEALSVIAPATHLYRPLDENPQILFPCLISLTIEMTSLTLEHLALEDFDALARARFLPVEHPESLAKGSSEVIPKLIIQRRGSHPAVWLKSHLYKESISAIREQYDGFEETHFTWSESRSFR